MELQLGPKENYTLLWGDGHATHQCSSSLYADFFLHRLSQIGQKNAKSTVINTHMASSKIW